MRGGVREVGEGIDLHTTTAGCVQWGTHIHVLQLSTPATTLVCVVTQNINFGNFLATGKIRVVLQMEREGRRGRGGGGGEGKGRGRESVAVRLHHWTITQVTSPPRGTEWRGS